MWEDKRKKWKESSSTRLDRLAKGAFVKVGSMTWDVCIHACSHGLLGCGYDFEAFHSCIAIIFCWIIHDDGCFWTLSFFPSMRVSQGISCVTIFWVCFLFSCMWLSIECLFQIYYGLCGNSYFFVTSFLTTKYRRSDVQIEEWHNILIPLSPCANG